MSDISRKLASGSALRVLNLGAQLFASLLLVPFVIGCLGERQYGLWALIGKIIDYYGLLDLGITAAVSRHIAAAIGAKDNAQCNNVVSNALALYSGVAIVVAAATLVLCWLAPLFASNPGDVALFRNIVLVLGLNTAVEFPIRVFGGILTAQLRYDIMSLCKLVSLILRVSGIVAVLSLGYGILALAIVTVLSGVPEKIAYVYFAKKNHPALHIGTGYLSRATVRILYNFGIYVFLIQGFDLLKFNTDSFIIASFIDLEAVTHYGIASTLVSNFGALMGTVIAVLMPVFSRLEGEGEADRIKEAFFFSTKISVCMASFIGFGLIAWGRHFIERWMGPAYLDAYPCLVFLAVGCTIGCWQWPALMLLYGKSKHKYYCMASGFEAAAILALSMLLIRWYGIQGVAAGIMIPGVVLQLFIQPVYVCRVTGMPYQEYVQCVLRAAGVAGFALIVPSVISMAGGAPEYGRLVLIGAASAFAYTGIIWKYGFTFHESRQILEAVLPKRFWQKSYAVTP